ncbi:MAG: IPT/TIG domain-containing protein [Polyangiaceae bacterium]|nr:IPT/TIG domain-containing protein [Polyangiaceae bacterium]
MAYGDPPYGPFETGANVEPLSTSSGNSLLFDADRTIFYVLDFFGYLITTYPGPRLVQAMAAAGVMGANALPLSRAVAQKYPTDPGPYLQENQFQFPLLCVYRTRATTTQKTAGWEEDQCGLEVLYALPPLNLGQAERVQPILNAVVTALRHKLTQSYDPGYAPPGGQPGDSPWDPPFAFVDQIALTEWRFGFLEGTNNLYFPAVTITGFVKERENYVPTGAGPLNGADITGDLYGADGTVLDPFVQASTASAPTITALSVSSGPAGGGTVVTLTGTGFENGPQWGPAELQVLFGGRPASAIRWNSPTRVAATTPAMLGAGTVAVVLTNPDGQTATSPTRFTFA